MYTYFEQIYTVTHKNIQAHMHMCMHHNYFITPRNGVPCGDVTGVATCAKNDIIMTRLYNSIPKPRNLGFSYSISVVLPLHLPAIVLQQCSTILCVNISYFCYI